MSEPVCVVDGRHADAHASGALASRSSPIVAVAIGALRHARRVCTATNARRGAQHVCGSFSSNQQHTHMASRRSSPVCAPLSVAGRAEGTLAQSGRQRRSDSSCATAQQTSLAQPAWAAAAWQNAGQHVTDGSLNPERRRTVKNARIPDGGGSAGWGRRKDCHCVVSRGWPPPPPPPPRAAVQSRLQWPGWPHLKQLLPLAPSPPRPPGGAAAAAAVARASASRSEHAVAVQLRHASSSYFSLPRRE